MTRVPLLWALVSLAVFCATWVGSPTTGWAQQVNVLSGQRDVQFTWDPYQRALYATLQFREAVDQDIRHKLTRGLPTEILFTALLYAVDAEAPLSTTYQTCKITWHVWEEMYRVEITRANTRKTQRHWTPTINGVLRRCAEANRLLVADSRQVSPGRTVYLNATVRVNPVSEELLKKLKRWVSRPSTPTAATPGAALFSTFTGLFMQRVSDAERTVTFTTRSRPL